MGVVLVLFNLALPSCDLPAREAPHLNATKALSIEGLVSTSPFLDPLNHRSYGLNMTIAVDNRVTAEDYRALPEGGQRYQLIEGDLYMAPAPNRFHQEISWKLTLIIGNYLETHPIGKAFSAPFDVYLDNDNVFQPDLVFVARENYRVLTDAGVEGVPDLVIEILSPGTAILDRNAKQRIYAQTGVKEMWLVDPETTTVAVYYLQQNAAQPAAIYSTADRFTTSFFPSLVFSVAEFFKR